MSTPGFKTHFNVPNANLDSNPLGGNDLLNTTQKAALVGCPNVGKSVLFNNLTGRYVTVANYPGTTIEVARGSVEIGGTSFEVIDTPGLYSFFPVSEEEKVARNILFQEDLSLVIHVIDAKNIERMLPLTLQMKEANLPILVVLNMMDESRERGFQINREKLEEVLGLPVVETVSITGEGMSQLQEEMVRAFQQNDLVEKKRPLLDIEDSTDLSGVDEMEVAIALKREASCISSATVKKTLPEKTGKPGRLQEVLSRLTTNPFTGFPILFFILYWGLYKFVGVFGAGTVVDFMEKTVFETYLNPFFIRLVDFLIPWALLQDLFVGEYGLLTLGVRYAFALILPIVAFYFMIFAILEDSGYLPRLAMLLDRGFKMIGLSGRAVIPMVLGLGCATMATMVTRTLPTKRERFISTLLLSLAIPCSAQLGIILALLSFNGMALLLWAFVVGMVFLLIGSLSARLLPGDQPTFYMELPPLRLPKLKHVLTKTYVRVKWYFKEIFPLFLAASALIWLGQLVHLFDVLIRCLSFPVRLIGLPQETAQIFLMGFFRRDYGAAGLYDLAGAGVLSGIQLVVACIALTLFLPCIAQFLMNVKERGWRVGLSISLFTLFFSFGVAFAVNLILVKSGVVL